MLTKEERAAVSKRLCECDCTAIWNLYKAVIGEEEPNDTSYDDDVKTLCRGLIDLCDTSNMVELPLDKDGEVIHIGDVVYDDFRMEREVSEFRFPFDGACIYARIDGNYFTYRPDELTHKKPVTIASLVGEIRRTLSQTTIINKEATSKLWEITDQIEMLGDSND